MAFFVGQKVECIRAGGINELRIPLCEKQVYTVRAVIPEDQYGPEHLLLAELHNGIARRDNRERSYKASRFRPLTSPKSETSFTEGAPKDSER